MPGVSGVREVVRERVGQDAWHAWFEGLDWVRQDEAVVLRCPDRFARDWIRKRYRSTLEELADEGVTLLVEQSGSEPTSVRGVRPLSAPHATSPTPRRHSRSVGLGSEPALELAAGHAEPARTADAFAGFVSEPGNALALEAARAVAEDRAGRCVPLLLSGGTGVGKTHLARAIERHAPASVLYRSAEEFTSEVTQGIQTRRMAEVRHRYRRALNVLILENVQFLAGKRATQTELFHTLEHLMARGTRIVLTSNCPPGELDVDPELRSRIASGLVAPIAPPELETRRSILRAKAAAGGARVPEDCIGLLADRPVTSVRDLLAGLNQVVARATLLREPVTAALVGQALAAVDLPGSRTTVEEIRGRVAGAYGLEPHELASRSRRQKFTRPRQLAMYLCRRYTDASLKEIGRAFNRDHSSVIYALDVFERRLVEQPRLRYEVESLAARF